MIMGVAKHRRQQAPEGDPQKHLAAAVIATAREDLFDGTRCMACGALCDVKVNRKQIIPTHSLCAKAWFLSSSSAPNSFRWWCQVMQLSPDFILDRLEAEGLL